MTLPELLSRVEAATGPDRELNRDIWEAVTNECTHRETQFVYLENDERELECVNCGADTYGADKWSGLTASIDACTEIAARMFPNYCWVVSGAWRSAAPNANIGDDEQEFEATAATPALALLAAMLKALIARQEETQ